MKLARHFSLLLALAASPLFAGTPRLDSPIRGQSLHAGDELVIRWEDPSPPGREWEAFLSLDGGHTYPLRLTPHLSSEIRTYAWEAPELAAADARIRLRFGDERSETQVDFPEPFAIRPSGRGRILEASCADIGRRPFPGEEESVAWTEASPSGGLSRLVSPPSPAGLASGTSWESARRSLIFVQSSGRHLEPSADHRGLDLASSTGFSPRLRPPLPRSRLALTSRLNL